MDVKGIVEGSDDCCGGGDDVGGGEDVLNVCSGSHGSCLGSGDEGICGGGGISSWSAGMEIFLSSVQHS